MRKKFVDKISEDNVLTGNDHNHVSVVLRAKVGDELVLCCGDGYDCRYQIIKIDSKNTYLKFIDKTECNAEPSIAVELFVALLKADKLEWVCQKCTELGVSAITPFISDYVQVKKEFVKVERLNKICKEAAQQCGRGKVPTVNQPIKFADMLRAVKKFDNVLFLYEKEGAKLKESGLKKGSVAIIVGSEGGFSASEANEIIGIGVTPINLGKRILRAETACVAATTLAMYEAGELQ